MRVKIKNEKLINYKFCNIYLAIYFGEKVYKQYGTKRFDIFNEYIPLLCIYG